MMRILLFAAGACALAAAAPSVLSSLDGAAPAGTPVETSLTKPAGESQEPETAIPVQPASKATSGRSVRLPADGGGHFTGEFRMNGRRVQAMVDTGATVVAINRSTASRLGLNLSPADFVHEVSTANGRVKAAAVTIERLEIGRIEVADVQALVLDDRSLSGTLVGMSFLGRLQRFEMKDGALVLEQ